MFSIHTTPEEFENGASVNTHPEKLSTENGAFRKHLLKTEEFENRALRFSVDRKHFENGAFRKRSRDLSARVFLKHKSKMAGTTKR